VPTTFFKETPMKAKNNFRVTQKCVKISRGAREDHAVAEKLFTTSLKRRALQD
jgi:hypothetical protein